MTEEDKKDSQNEQTDGMNMQLFAICIAIGPVIGLILGMLMDNFALGIALSVPFGVILGVILGMIGPQLEKNKNSRQ